MAIILLTLMRPFFCLEFYLEIVQTLFCACPLTVASAALTACMPCTPCCHLLIGLILHLLHPRSRLLAPSLIAPQTMLMTCKWPALCQPTPCHKCVAPQQPFFQHHTYAHNIRFFLLYCHMVCRLPGLAGGEQHLPPLFPPVFRCI